MRRIKDLYDTFINTTTCMVAGSAIYINIFHYQEDLGSEILLQLLFVSLATSLGIYLYPERAISKKEIMIRTLIHYIYVNIVVFGCGLWFEWYQINSMAMIIGLFVTILTVFSIVSFICWKKAEKFAIIINQKLKEYQMEKGDQ